MNNIVSFRMPNRGGGGGPISVDRVRMRTASADAIDKYSSQKDTHQAAYRLYRHPVGRPKTQRYEEFFTKKVVLAEERYAGHAMVAFAREAHARSAACRVKLKTRSFCNVAFTTVEDCKRIAYSICLPLLVVTDVAHPNEHAETWEVVLWKPNSMRERSWTQLEYGGDDDDYIHY